MTAETTLDDDQIAMLLDEVIAMAASGRSLVVGLADLDDRTMGKLGRAASEIRNRILTGASAAESVASLSKTYHAPIKSAMDVLATTGSIEPIDETVRLIRQTVEQRHELRLASINPLLNVVVAATVLCCVMPWILVSLSQTELIKTPLSPTVNEIIHTFAAHFVMATIATAATIAVVMTLIYVVVSRPLEMVRGLRDHGVFCRWMAMQIAPQSSPQSRPSLEPASMIETAAAVVGRQFAATWSPVAENIRRGAISNESLDLPEETLEPVRDCIVDLVSGRRDGNTIALDLRKLGDLYSHRSHVGRAWWIVVVPRVISVLVVLGIVAILLRAILVPLIETIGEVAS